MNIRTVTNPILPIESHKVNEAKTVRLNQSDEDRDANGRKEQQEPDQSPLNQDEFQQAKKYLEDLDSLKTSSLEVSVEVAGDIRVFLIKDKAGTIVRRIPEHEMRHLFGDKDKTKGQIFDKAG